ncbi:hypothetical protein [Streptomyces mirabilis]|uniref:hypothetical protein n=1 Tax=Streptomyces mirabilis TaxID=68239 RepID=UPI0033DC0DD2
MHEDPPPAAARLTASQATRIDFARREWKCARGEDLACLDPAGLILLVERLRGRLGDVLDLVTEVCGDTPRDPPSGE